MNDLNKENLYRREALEALSLRDYSRPIARMPSLWWAFGALVVFIAISGIVFLVNFTYSRKETVVGWLMPDKGLIRLNSGQHGIVETLMVEEGSEVQEGESVMVLSSDSSLADGRGRTTEALLAEISKEETELGTQLELAQKLRESNTTTLESSLAALEREKASLDDQIREQEQLIEIALDLFNRFESLRNQAVADIQIEQQREALVAQRHAKEGLMQRSHALDREMQTLQDRLHRLPLETDQLLSELRARMAVLAERRIELSSRGQQVIISPVTGTIASLGARAGSSIDPSRPLVEILPEGNTLYAEVYIPSRAIGFVEAGMLVRLMYDAFPHQNFGSGEGRVSHVSNTVLRPEEIPTPLQMQESAYKARIALDSQTIDAHGRSFPLRPGMALQAEIILEQRTFLQWLLEPVLARRGWKPSEEGPQAAPETSNEK